MPLIKIQTSVAAPERDRVDAMLKTLSQKLASHLGKPEAYIMTAFEPDIAMTFAGSTEPACFVEIKSVGTMGGDRTRAMSQDFCQEIADTLGIAPGRTYIEFADSPGAMWGWNGRTFG
ncbi:MAG: phenylpyruvate tautomerase MIF-related protein [Cyanobacteria bacterium J06641_5]